MKANNGILIIDDFGRQVLFAARSAEPVGSFRWTGGSTI